MNLSDLPGSELILPGLDDLHNGKTNTNAGLTFPKDHLVPEPELTLYARLQTERDDAYPYYNALLKSLNSFCHALELMNKYG
jgi:hypothetical protein